jgi:aldose sugar dehydrogenase
LVNSNIFSVILLIIILLLSSGSIKYLNDAGAQQAKVIGEQQPIINDPNLKAELVVNGIELPTGMAFLGPDDILVLEKEKGTVQRIIDGKILPEPLLNVDVANKSERGMLGIAVSEHENGLLMFSYIILKQK